MVPPAARVAAMICGVCVRACVCLRETGDQGRDGDIDEWKRKGGVWGVGAYLVEDGALGGVAHTLALLGELLHLLGGCLFAGGWKGAHRGKGGWMGGSSWRGCAKDGAEHHHKHTHTHIYINIHTYIYICIYTRDTRTLLAVLHPAVLRVRLGRLGRVGIQRHIAHADVPAAHGAAGGGVAALHRLLGHLLEVEEELVAVLLYGWVLFWGGD